MVEDRHSNLQAMRHARAVDLRENVAGQICFVIEILNQRQWMVYGCRSSKRLEDVERLIALELPPESRREQAFAEGVAVFVAAVKRCLEGIEAVVIPLGGGFVGAANHEGDVDADRVGLPDTIETPDALFDEAGV